MRKWGERALKAAWWLLPPAFCLVFYRYGFQTWFQQDDFAWLGLGLDVHTWQDLLEALFRPQAQGTIRPWSERLFFLVLNGMFGLDPRPFHAVVATTQLANIWLLQSATFKITRSRIAGLAAPILWLAGVGLSNPLSWLSSYNQVLCAFFILLAFRLMLEAIESGERKWWYWQVAVFVLGFGALEINVVYPALAAGYCYLFARAYFKRSLWLFPISIVYAGIHQAVAHNPTEGVYAQHWDLSMATSYFRYVGTALAGGQIMPHWRVPEWSWEAAAWLMGLTLAAFAVTRWRRGDRLPAYGALWFSIALAPVLPLRDHFTEYYLTIPSIGISWMLGTAASAAWGASLPWRAGTAALLLVYAGLSMPVNRTVVRWRHDRGQRIKVLVEGLERAHQLHPNKMILLTGMDSELAWSGLFDQPERLFGAREVYLLPQGNEQIDLHPELGDVTNLTAQKVAVARALSRGDAVVYSYEGTLMRNITRKTARNIPAEWAQGHPRRVRVGLPQFAEDLGSGWEPSEGDWRWMGRRAEVRLAGPSKDGEKLFVQGYCPPGSLETPVHLTVSADGMKLGSFEVTRANSSFEASFDLPKALMGRAAMTVLLETDRAVSGGSDGRELSLTVGSVGLR
jgi:hypothetical protein